MNVVIATCFKSNEERVDFIKDVFESRGDNVNVITTDFDHINHKKRQDKNKNYFYQTTKIYRKNLSLQRIISHVDFSESLFRKIEDYQPELIWLMIPANSLIKKASIYKKNHPMVKIILDVIDMWPESFPNKLLKKTLVFKKWENLRSKNINVADCLITECNYYKEKLNKEYFGKIFTLPWSRNQKVIQTELTLPKNIISLVYLGSINNIINIDMIIQLIKNMDKEVIFHIIGNGENKSCFINELKKVCTVIDHGEQRDNNTKAEILKNCHAGINIYKEDLYIGLTVKSIDYLQFGLPIINNIKGDTWEYIDKYNVGFNINKNTTLKYSNLDFMRQNNNHIFDLYENYFSKKSFTKICESIINEVLQ